MFSTIKADLRRKAEWYDLPPDKVGSLIKAFFSDGSTAQLLYRLMRFCQSYAFLKPIAMIVYRLNVFFGHVVIGRGANIGEEFVIIHSFGIVINSAVKAGTGLVIEHGVTIGAEKGLSPVLGNNVFIGAGAKIIGAVTIGNDVKIGANAVVTKSLPDGATAVGVPAKVIKIYGEKVSADSTVI